MAEVDDRTLRRAVSEILTVAETLQNVDHDDFRGRRPAGFDAHGAARRLRVVANELERAAR